MIVFSLDPPLVVPAGNRIVAGDSGDRGRDKILLGTLAETGQKRELWLDTSSEQVVAIFGKRGTGKSYTLGVLLEGLSSGLGENQLAAQSTPRASLVFDIMDIFWSSQIPLSENGPPELARQFGVMQKKGLVGQQINAQVWIPAGYEQPEIDPPNVRCLHIGAHQLELDDWAALFDVKIFTEPRGMLIHDVIRMVRDTGYDTTAGGHRVAQEVFDFAALLRCLEESGDIQANYNSETVRSVRQRMQTYGGLPMFGGSPTALNVLLQPNQSAILMLGRTPDALKSVIVSVLIRNILRSRQEASFARKRLDLTLTIPLAERKELEKRIAEGIPRTWILLDEAQVLAGADGSGAVARDALIKYAKEGRNYGLSLCVATQQPSALDARLTSQVETLILHQLTSPKDVDVAVQNIRSPMPTTIKLNGSSIEASDVLRRLPSGTAIFSTGNGHALVRFCVVAIRPRVTAHGGYEA